MASSSTAFPTPPGLTPNEQTVWADFINFLRAITSVMGEVNNDQYIGLLQTASFLTWPSIEIASAGGVGEAPGGAQQPWARNGQAQSWVAISLDGGTY